MGKGVVNLKRCVIDRKGRLMCPDKRGYNFAFSNFDLNNNVFVVGGCRYDPEKLREIYEDDVIKEMVAYTKACLTTFEV